MLVFVPLQHGKEKPFRADGRTLIALSAFVLRSRFIITYISRGRNNKAIEKYVRTAASKNVNFKSRR